MQTFDAQTAWLLGSKRLKFLSATDSPAGVAELEGKGWAVLASFGPIDGGTYVLLGQSDVSAADVQARKLKDQERRIAELETALAKASSQR
jgi:hypothetical protein